MFQISCTTKRERIQDRVRKQEARHLALHKPSLHDKVFEITKTRNTDNFWLWQFDNILEILNIFIHERRQREAGGRAPWIFKHGTNIAGKGFKSAIFRPFLLFFGLFFVIFCYKL